MSDYQKEQEVARRRQERREKRAERQLRRVLRQESASLLDKTALAGAQEKIQDALEAERDAFLERDWYVRAGNAGETPGRYPCFDQTAVPQSVFPSRAQSE
jgi:hypothetical protein